MKFSIFISEKNYLYIAWTSFRKMEAMSRHNHGFVNIVKQQKIKQTLQ